MTKSAVSVFRRALRHAVTVGITLAVFGAAAAAVLVG
jgi:hypothetical protein